uniref:DNA-directed RNA polymerase n=1 Tax=Rhabditophanes sp. KR3021 TaxID=114890 RepID=A0AC35TZC6_9BILA
MECRVCVIRDLALDRIVMRQGIVTVDKEGDDFADMGLIVKYGNYKMSELYVGAIQPMANMLTTMDGELLRSHFKKCKCLDLDNIPAEGLRHPPTLLESCGKVVNERGIEDILPNNLEYWGRSFVECDVCGATIPHSSHRCSIMTGRLGTIATTINGNANAMNTPIAVMLQTCKCCAKASLVKQNIHKLFGEFVYNFGRGEV